MGDRFDEISSELNALRLGKKASGDAGLVGDNDYFTELRRELRRKTNQRIDCTGREYKLLDLAQVIRIDIDDAITIEKNCEHSALWSGSGKGSARNFNTVIVTPMTRGLAFIPGER